MLMELGLRLEKLSARCLRLETELSATLKALHHAESVIGRITQRRGDKARAEHLARLTDEDIRALPVDWEIPHSQQCPRCQGKGRL